MKIGEMFQRGTPLYSFEFFPPKTDAGEKNLYRTIEKLAPLAPDFVSVTYGAGGTTRTKTIEWVSTIKQKIGIETMAHLTCVGASRAELAEVLDQLRDAGIENVIALRGDPPKGEEHFVPHPDGFAHASELVAFIRGRYDFCIAGACYPEGHVECPDKERDLRYFKEKVDQGLDFAITQLFYDNRDYFSFVERARKIGITIPIVAGIMPITNVGQIKRFTKVCGATIPKRLLCELDEAADDPQAVIEIGVRHAIGQCRELLEGGVPGIHFYTLNKSPATRLIFEVLRTQ